MLESRSKAQKTRTQA